MFEAMMAYHRVLWEIYLLGPFGFSGLAICAPPRKPRRTREEMKCLLREIIRTSDHAGERAAARRVLARLDGKLLAP